MGDPAQLGHVSPAMMAVYRHVRRKALEEAATALEPSAPAPVVCALSVGEVA
ncbi:MAG: hypothetical protein ACREXX_05600 [Gammaproteobacteria bacterium]